MSIQAESMRAGADRYVTSYEKDGKHHGVEMVNHPSPSGCDRWMPTYSDKRGWDTPQEAIAKLTEVLPPV